MSSITGYRRIRRSGRRTALKAVCLLAVSVLGISACSSDDNPSASDKSDKKMAFAYLAFAATNSYEAPQIEAAKKAAEAAGASFTVIDANGNPQTQVSQVQDAIASGKYDGFFMDPIDGAGVVPVVKKAIDAGIKVVALNTVVGDDLTTNEPQVEGLSASVVYPAYERGKNLGELLKQACTQVSGTCNVGYMFSFKASTFDQGVRSGFDEAVDGSNIKIVAEGEDGFSAAGGLKSAQQMLQANPEINAMVGVDQGMAGTTQALKGLDKLGDVMIIGVGGSVAGLDFVKDGTWYGDIPTLPATQGKLAAEALVKAVRDGEDSGAIDPNTELPAAGATQDNVDQFTGQWNG